MATSRIPDLDNLSAEDLEQTRPFIEEADDVGTVTAEEENPAATLGWRFMAGVVLIVGGYAALLLIPVVITADLPAWAKSGLAAVLATTPFLSKA
jgi:hypothetical protein